MNTKNIFDSLLNSLPKFEKKLEDFLAELKTVGLDLFDLEIDHIALRYKDPQSVDKIRDEILAISEWHDVTNVNGRPIYIIKLLEPLTVLGKQVWCIELPYPKSNHSYSDGWEHIEVVLGGKATNIAELESDLSSKFPEFIKENLDGINYDADEPSVDDSNQLPNPSISIEKYKGLAVKIHAKSIEEVIKGR